MPRRDANQGEGNREADRDYRNKATTIRQRETWTGRPDIARRALDGIEGQELRDAERAGKAAARGKIPSSTARPSPPGGPRIIRAPGIG